jgi:predicted PurR-regulated permease PerM
MFLLAFAGVLLGVFLHGLSDWLRQHSGLGYHWSLAAVVVSLLVLLGLAGWLLGAQISAQVSQLVQALPESLNQLRSQLERYPWGKWILSQAPDSGSLLGQGDALSRVTGFASSVLSVIGGIAVIVFVGLYAAVEPGFYRRGVEHLVPPARRGRAREVHAALGHALRWWLVARLASMSVVGILVSIGLTLLGIPMALALGLLAFFLVIIPNIGPVLAAVPAILVAWSQGSTQALSVLGLYVGIEIVESYVLLPVIERRTVRLPPALSILNIVLFGMVGGVLGAVVASPLLVAGMVLVKMLYVEDTLGDHSVRSLDPQ